MGSRAYEARHVSLRADAPTIDSLLSTSISQRCWKQATRFPAPRTCGLNQMEGQKPSTPATLTIIGVNLIMRILLEFPLLGSLVAPSWTPGAVERAKAWVGRHGHSAAVIALTVLVARWSSRAWCGRVGHPVRQDQRVPGSATFKCPITAQLNGHASDARSAVQAWVAALDANRSSPSLRERSRATSCPLTLLPAESSGGANVPSPPFPGDTVTIPPPIPLLAGRPTS